MSEPTYHVFHRTWWRRGPGGTRVPGAGRKTTIARHVSYAEARGICERWNASHPPGPLSRKCEFMQEGGSNPMKHRRYSRRNPARAAASKGIGTGTLLLLAGGAFVLLTPQGRALTARLTSGVHPTTVTPTTAAGIHPTGITWLDKLLGAGVQAGVQTIPSATSSFASWISGLFQTSPVSATTPLGIPGGTAGEILPGGGTTVTAPDILSGGYNAPYALPPLEPLPDLTLSDWMSTPIPDTSLWSTDLTLSPAIAPLPDLSAFDYSADFSSFNVGFFGLGAAPRLPIRYGLPRTIPAPLHHPTLLQPGQPRFHGYGELRNIGYSRTLRRPPSYR